MLNAKLVVVGGDAKAGEFTLKLPTVIGRGKEAGLTIPHALVSRAHTEVFEKNGLLCVKDLGSLNGTFVDNTKIENECMLQPNQLLTLGNVTFRAVYQPARPAPSMDAAATLDGRSSAATLKTKDAGPTTAPSLADTIDVSEKVDSKSAISEIDSFEPDDLDSFAGLSQVNSNVLDAQVRQIGKNKIDADVPDPPAALDASVIVDTGIQATPAVSSIDGFQPESNQEPVASFIEKIGDSLDVEQVVDSVKISIGEEAKNTNVDESRLGSFLKRLPK